MNECSLPLPPTLNHAYITHARGGKRIMTAETRQYKENVYLLLKTHYRLKKPYDRLSYICYRFFFPDNRKRDVPDNYGKILRDCLKGTLVTDDCWQCIDEEHFGPHGIDKENPRAEIRWEI